jgi:hypothetical protein
MGPMKPFFTAMGLIIVSVLFPAINVEFYDILNVNDVEPVAQVKSVEPLELALNDLNTMQNDFISSPLLPNHHFTDLTSTCSP